jgi:hypothetical protein
MSSRETLIFILAAFLTLQTALPAWAWNYAGHRAIASIA